MSYSGFAVHIGCVTRCVPTHTTSPGVVNTRWPKQGGETLDAVNVNLASGKKSTQLREKEMSGETMLQEWTEEHVAQVTNWLLSTKYCADRYHDFKGSAGDTTKLVPANHPQKVSRVGNLLRSFSRPKKWGLRLSLRPCLPLLLIFGASQYYRLRNVCVLFLEKQRLDVLPPRWQHRPETQEMSEIAEKFVASTCWGWGRAAGREGGDWVGWWDKG